VIDLSTEINPRQYRKRSDAVSVVAVAIHIAFVIAPLYISAIIGPSLFLIPLWLWFGLTMQGLLNLVHECAHYHVFKKRWGSDLLGRWVLAPLIVSDFDNYRGIHWSHHKELGSVKDPKYSYKIDIRGWRLLVFFLQCMIGVEAWRKLHYQNRERANTDLASSRFWIVRLLVAHCILAVSLFATAWRFGTHGARSAVLNTAIAYGVDIYGLAALTLFAATLRAIAEHQDGPDHPETVSQAVLRNLRCGPIERLIFGCYGFAEHATHHHYPAIPSYHLSNATAELAIRTPSLTPRLSYKEILLAQVRACQTAE
jgi:fatty acid desaturase